MKNHLKLKWVALLFAAILWSDSMKASHVMGADITYKMIDTVSGKYEFTFNRYRQCSGITFVTSSVDVVLLVDGVKLTTTVSVPITIAKDVTPLCTPPLVKQVTATNCPGQSPIINNIAGCQRVVGTFTIILGRASVYENGYGYVSYYDCCRNTEITNTTAGGGGDGFTVVTTFNRYYVDSSPVFTNYPVPFWCACVSNKYNHGTQDQDARYLTFKGKAVIRDSLSYETYIPWQSVSTTDVASIYFGIDASQTVETYKPGLDKDNFLYTDAGTYVSINTLTGDIEATPKCGLVPQVAVFGFKVKQWRAEGTTDPKYPLGYRRRQNGMIMRDLQITIRATCAPMADRGVITKSYPTQANGYVQASYGINVIDSNNVVVCGHHPGRMVVKGIGAKSSKTLMKWADTGIYRILPNNFYNFKFDSIRDSSSSAGVDTTYGICTWDSLVGFDNHIFHFAEMHCENGVKYEWPITVNVVFNDIVEVKPQDPYYCLGGKPVRLYAKTYNVLNPNYGWSPKTGIVAVSGMDSSWIDVAPSVNTTYTATIKDANAQAFCSITDKTLVHSIPPFKYTISPKSVSLCQSDTFSINISPQISDTPYVYNWTNTMNNTLFDKSTYAPTSTSSSPLAVASGTGKYVVEIASKYNCVLVDSVSVKVNSARPRPYELVFGAHRDTFGCPGKTVPLSARVFPAVSGLSLYKSNGVTTTATYSPSAAIYPATTCSGTGCYPNIYGTATAGSSSTTRILYTAAELTTMGLTPGTIRSLAFNVVDANVANFDRFTIKLGKTASTNDASVATLMYTVFDNSIYVYGNSWNNYPFTQGFDWNGTDNLIIELCVKRNTTTSLLNTYYTNGSVAVAKKVVYKASNTLGVDACGINTAWLSSGGSKTMPHIQFNMTGIDSSDNTMSAIWTPTAYATVTTSPNAIGKINTTDDYFKIQYGTSQCFGRDSLKVLDSNFSVKVSGSRVLCSSTTPAPITLTAAIVAGGTYSIKWKSNDPNLPTNDSQSTITVSPVAKGKYYYACNISDPTGCYTTDTGYVTLQDSLNFTLTTVNPTCSGKNGKIKINLPSGSKNTDYTYVWTFNVSTVDSATNLETNTYTVQLTQIADATCKGSQTARLVANVVPLNVAIDTTSILCNGGKADSLRARATNPLTPGPYKYLWSNGAKTQTIKSVPAGKYFVTVTDSILGCVEVDSFTLRQPTALSLASTITNIKCKGLNTGEVLITVTGGTPSNVGTYQYSWQSIGGGNATIPTFNQLTGMYADTMVVTATDWNGCTSALGVRIKEPATKLTVMLDSVDATTVGGSDGVIHINLSGGTQPYYASWDSKPKNYTSTMVWNPYLNKTSYHAVDSITGLAKSWYKGYFTDSFGCTAVDSILVNDIICNIKTLDSIVVNVNCFGQSTGQISFRTIDLRNDPTTAWYNYALYSSLGNYISQSRKLSSNDSATFAGLSPGGYSFRITTSKGCDEQSGLFTITENPRMSASTNGKPTTCYGYTDGGVTVTVTDAFPPFIYNYNDGNGWVSNDSITTGYDGDTLSNGKIHKIMYKNSLGCLDSTTVGITSPHGLYITDTVLKPISCFGDSNGIVLLNVMASDVNITSRGFQYFSKTGTDNNFLSDTLQGLKKDSFYATVRYLTSPTAQCNQKYVGYIDEPAVLNATVISFDSVSCSYRADGSITTLATGGTMPYTYKYTRLATGDTLKSDTIRTFFAYSNLDSGNYKIDVKDARNCPYTLTQFIYKPDTLNADTAITAANCVESNNGRITVSKVRGGNGGYTYYTDSFAITAPSSSVISTSASVSGLRGGRTYNTSVYDRKNCVVKFENYWIDTLYRLSVTKALKTDSAQCYGLTNGRLRLIAGSLSQTTAPYMYSWSSGAWATGESGTHDSLIAGAGTYNLTITDSAGCHAYSLGTIEQPDSFSIFHRKRDVTCYGGSDGSLKIFVLGGNPPYKYLWNTNPVQGSDSAYGLTAGTYTVQVTDAKKCTESKTFPAITQPVPFIVHVADKKDISCFGAKDGKIVLGIQGGVPTYTYQWSVSYVKDNPTQPDSIATYLSPSQDYRVTVTDANNCVATARGITIMEPDKLLIQKLAVDSANCPSSNDGKIEVTAVGGTITAVKQYEYSDNGGATYQFSNLFTNLKPATYKVVVRDNNNCLAIVDTSIGVPEELYIQAKKDSLVDSLKMGESVNLYFTQRTLSGRAASIQSVFWTPNENMSCADCYTPAVTPYTSQTYQVNVRYAHNCLATSDVNVPVKALLDIFIPSAFSPGNHDGINDIIKVYGNGIKSVTFAVFNRWGEKVFESHDMSKGWDGTYKGEDAPSGVYTYFVEATYLTNLVRNKQGSITLIR